jgi:hypothetical protein
VPANGSYIPPPYLAPFDEIHSVLKHLNEADVTVREEGAPKDHELWQNLPEFVVPLIELNITNLV